MPQDTTIINKKDTNIDDDNETISQDTTTNQDDDDTADSLEAYLSQIPEQYREQIKESLNKAQDYTKKTQELAEQRRMIERMQTETQQKIDFYDQFVNSEEFRKQVAAEMGFKPPTTEKAINSKVKELLDNMSSEEKETIEYIVQQTVEKALNPIKSFVQEQQTHVVQSRQEKIAEVLSDFAEKHPDFKDVEKAMAREAITLGLNFKTMPVSKMKSALNTLYKAVTADKMLTTGRVKGIKDLVNRTTKAASTAAKNNRRAASVDKPVSTFDTIEDAFKASLNR